MTKEEAKQHIQDRIEYEAREVMNEQRDPDKEYDADVESNLIEEAERKVPMEYFNEFPIEWNDLTFERRHEISGHIASHINEMLGGCDEDWAMDKAREICEKEFPHWIKISICKDKEELR